MKEKRTKEIKLGNKDYYDKNEVEIVITETITPAVQVVEEVWTVAKINTKIKRINQQIDELKEKRDNLKKLLDDSKADQVKIKERPLPPEGLNMPPLPNGVVEPTPEN